jgi:hypothetical protein
MEVKNVTLKIIEASEGKIRTDGKGDYARVKYLSDGQRPEDFHEITIAEYEAILAEEEAKNALQNMQ